MLPLTDGITDLRSGLSLWEAENLPQEIKASPAFDGHIAADIVIIGAGITGAFLAERLTRRGQRVVVVDRHAPQQGSTAASTSLLQWELDAPLLELEDRLGFDHAAQVYQRSRLAVERIGRLAQHLEIACRFAPRGTLYLAGNQLDAGDLREEQRLRTLAGIEGELLDRDQIWRDQGLCADAALYYSGSAEADPIALARGLLAVALQRGALVASPMVAVAYDATPSGIVVATDRGTEISGKVLILANGYEMPSFVQATAHRVVSTWALATEPLQADLLWPTRALVWEASDPYLYMRTTLDGRIVAGGEDEEITDPQARDALTGGKIEAVLAKLGRLLPGKPDLTAAYGWAGFFGETADGLPLIGPVPGMPGCFAAFGYGGNGITFSATAAEMLDRLIVGDSDQARDLFAIDRQA